MKSMGSVEVFTSSPNMCR